MKYWIDRLTTLPLIFLLGWGAFDILHWFIVGADWQVVTANLSLYAIGSYPEDKRWRPVLWIVVIILLTLITLLGPRKGFLRRFLPAMWILIVPSGIWLLAGRLGLMAVRSSKWGGFSLTLFLTFGSAILALPLGVLLALGRRSNLTLVRFSSTAYIEIIRALPLIAVLFFGQLLIPLFLPPGIEINRVLRAVFSYSLFAAAYIAEDVRCGLQAIPPTQWEAASVLGLSQRQCLQFIILPQALRIAIPALTNQAIGLLQNTSLMAVLGLSELLGISLSLIANPEFIGRHLEVYVWLAAIYWLVCTTMAILSRHLEHQLDPLVPAR